MDRGELTAAGLRAIAGDDARQDVAPDGVPRVTPATGDGCARILRAASQHAWRVRIEHDDWSPRDAAADLALSTRGLTTLRGVSPTDQVATAGAGLSVATLATEARWFAADPPGIARTVGGILATATAGPLRAGYGGLRDQVLGLTAVTGDGRTVTVGGRVMKNVAGYDIGKLLIGGFDAFGVIVEAHLRLRAAPRQDTTRLHVDTLPALIERALTLLASGAQPAALELVYAGGKWTLAIRTHAATTSSTDGDTADQDFWDRVANGPAGPVVLRVGTVPDGVQRAVTLLAAELPPADWISASVYPGSVRWSGTANATVLRGVRDACARHEMPLTLERAPWPLRHAVGVHGAYREGVAPLIAGLKAAFDPAGVLVG